MYFVRSNLPRRREGGNVKVTMALLDLEYWNDANRNVRIWVDPLLMDSDSDGVKPRDPSRFCPPPSHRYGD